MTTKDVAVIGGGGGEVVERSGRDVAAPETRLTAQGIALIAENMAMAEKLVTMVLKPGVDYGHIPGIRGDCLWDPGASKIVAAWNCYFDHDVKFHEETEDLISWAFQVKVVSRSNQQVVGTGMGACSTREKKYGKRWLSNPLELGYTAEQVKMLRTELKDDTILYHVDNPEIGDLTHTIMAMAAKRGETDAAKSLPGVGSALRQLLDPEGSKLTGEPDWGWFEGIIKNAGLSHEAAHKILKVSSMKEWTGSGHTLDEAITALLKWLVDDKKKQTGKQAPPAAAPAMTSTATGAATAASSGGAATPGTPAFPTEVTIKSITKDFLKSVDALEFYAKHFFKMEGPALWQKLGYASKQGFIDAKVQTPYEAFMSLVGDTGEPSGTENIPF